MIGFFGTMIKKEIKEYKQGTRDIQRINILKKDNVDGIVYILKEKEYKDLLNEIKRLKEIINNQKQEYKTIQEIEQIHKETIIKLTNEHKTEIKKYTEQNTILRTILRQIFELGFIDLLRNKHKKIAKKQIKELDNDNVVYELVEKKNKNFD